jgi:hypothetical protein
LLFIGAQSFDLAVIPEGLAGALLASPISRPGTTYTYTKGFQSLDLPP